MSELVTKQRRRDWYQIIRVDLLYAGVNQAMIARACKRDPKTVENWTNGGEPKDSDARIILVLYRKHCPQKYIEHMKQMHPDFIFDTNERMQVARPAKRRSLIDLAQMTLFDGVKA
jgi:hypothetical protein